MNLWRMMWVRWLAVTMVMAGCSTKSASPTAKSVSPATVAKLPGEADLVVVTLKPEAEERLKIATATIERRPAPRALTMGGDVVVPPGRASIVSAPQTGTLIAAERTMAPTPGLAVKKGQAIFTLVPLLSADRAVLSPLERVNFEAAKADAEGQLEVARPRFDNAKLILERTEKLAQSRDVPSSALVDARNA